MNTRRQFLMGCSKVAAVAVAAAPSVMLAGPRELDPMAMANFRRNLKTIFLVQMDASTNVELELIRVKLASTRSLGRHPLKAADRKNERFSLLFRGPVDAPMAQDTYTFQHKQFVTFPLFIVPMGKDQKYRYYEAVFNRRNIAATW